MRKFMALLSFCGCATITGGTIFLLNDAVPMQQVELITRDFIPHLQIAGLVFVLATAILSILVLFTPTPGKVTVPEKPAAAAPPATSQPTPQVDELQRKAEELERELVDRKVLVESLKIQLLAAEKALEEKAKSPPVPPIPSIDPGELTKQRQEFEHEIARKDGVIESLRGEIEAGKKALDEASKVPPPKPRLITSTRSDGIPDVAFQILFMFQKEGRLLDFLMEDISGVDDGDLGSAIRPIHEGCRKIFQERLLIEPVLASPEGETVNLGEKIDPGLVKLTGNVPVAGPYFGVLVHKGWKIRECKLPELVSGWAGDAIVPAEVEIS